MTETQRDLAERTLLKDAERLTIRDLRRRTDRLMDVYASKADVDSHENDLLVSRERTARQNASFVSWDMKNGMHGFRGQMPDAEFVMLKTAVDALAAPSRAHLSDPDATLGPIPEDTETDLKDGTLLCTRDHHFMHDSHWEHRIAAGGHIEWRPAGATTWQRNPRNGSAA